MRQGVRHPGADEVEQAMAALNRLERAIWGRLIRNGLTIPESRLFRSIPRYGVRGATQIQVGILWIIPAQIWVIGAFIADGANGAAHYVGDALILLGLLCIGCAVTRLMTSRRHARAAP